MNGDHSDQYVFGNQPKGTTRGLWWLRDADTLDAVKVYATENETALDDRVRVDGTIFDACDDGVAVNG